MCQWRARCSGGVAYVLEQVGASLGKGPFGDQEGVKARRGDRSVGSRSGLSSSRKNELVEEQEASEAVAGASEQARIGGGSERRRRRRRSRAGGDKVQWQ